jgi:GNAT superfamily N-acetyltransferase
VVDRLTLLVEDRSGEAPRWVPAADVDLSGVRVVARGPLPLELSAGTVVDPEAAVLLDGATPSPMGRHPTVVTARREGAVVGVAWGSAAGGDPEGVVVRADARRQGVGTHLRREWAFRSTQRISR